MFRLNTMQTNGAGGTDTFKLTNFPKGYKCAGILMRFAYPVTVSGLGGMAPSLAAFLPSLFQSLTIRHGATGQRTAYPTAPAIEVRDVHRFITRNEMPNNLSSVAWGVAGAYTVLFDLFIPWAVEELTDGRLRCPGWTQMQTMIIDIVEGPAWSAVNEARTVGANQVIDVDVLVYPSELDVAGPILSYFRANNSSLHVDGPDGVLLGDWEISAAQASTAIALFSGNVSDRIVAGNVPPYVAGDKYLLNWDTGISPITDRVTMGYSPDEGQSSADLPSGVIGYTQASQYVPTIQLRGLYWPPMDSAEATEHTQAIAANNSQPVVTTLPAVAEAMPGNVARTLMLEAHPPATPGFVLQTGLLATSPDAQPFLAVPEQVSLLNGSLVEAASASGAQTVTAQQSRQLEQMTRRVPGLAQATHGNSQTKAVTDPAKYLRALESVAGGKGMASLNKLKSSMKL